MFLRLKTMWKPNVFGHRPTENILAGLDATELGPWQFSSRVTWRAKKNTTHTTIQVVGDGTGNTIQLFEWLVTILILLGGLEHKFYDFPETVGNGIIIPTDGTPSFFREIETTNQYKILYIPFINGMSVLNQVVSNHTYTPFINGSPKKGTY